MRLGYDAEDRLIRKQVLVGATQTPGTLERYGYQGFDRTLQMNQNYVVSHRFLHGAGVDALLLDEAFAAGGPRSRVCTGR
ncbi:MAG: hypothetical protein ACRCT8_16035 [Lacipirellulaceae bacterium]